MSYQHLVRKKNEKLVCPFCHQELVRIINPYFSRQNQSGFECKNCSVPCANTLSGQPFSRYNIGVYENLEYFQEDEVIKVDRLIVEETFFIYTGKDNKWYNVSNNIIKEQTTVVLATPTTKEHLGNLTEEPVGMAWISKLAILPFVSSWDLKDESATLKKLATYLIFS